MKGAEEVSRALFFLWTGTAPAIHSRRGTLTVPDIVDSFFYFFCFHLFSYILRFAASCCLQLHVLLLLDFSRNKTCSLLHNLKQGMIFRLSDDETQSWDTGGHTPAYEEQYQCLYHLKQQVTHHTVHTILVNDTGEYIYSNVTSELVSLDNL